DLARARSEDPGTGQKGGDLGYLIRGSLVPEFENALFQMKTGEVSDPVASPYGFHLIERTGDRKLSAAPLDDAAKKRIRAALESQKFQQWFDRTRAQYAVSVNDAALDDLAVSTAPGRP
ncbi:MAG TPA: peptidylprolyl isomerase, partial [Elusimicrobiota bacterium]|nr:peptidylprolyl isomerase [Elusimicrobiota bacterium]